MDGVYFGQGRVINEGFFDLAGLEVLKGPQSLFYGKNATAGVISINTANPTSTFQARTRVSYEFNAKQPSVEGFVSGPVTDTLALRLAGRWSKMYGGLVKIGRASCRERVWQYVLILVVGVLLKKKDNTMHTDIK